MSVNTPLVLLVKTLCLTNRHGLAPETQFNQTVFAAKFQATRVQESHQVTYCYIPFKFQFLHSRYERMVCAVRYTLIIGIQTLYQLHGNSATNPFDSFTLEQLSAMITSNNGTLQVQADLPALNKCLKDIKTQLGNIQNELSEPQKSSKPKAMKPSTNNAQKFVQNLMGTNSTTNSNENTKEINTKSTSASSREAAPSNHEVVKKADHKWRDSDNAVFKLRSIFNMNPDDDSRI